MTDPLIEVLNIARDRGFLGPGDVAFHVEHASAFLEVTAGERVLDLGSGGGIPGLLLAIRRPDLLVTLLDANLRRTQFLAEAVEWLGLAERVTVVRERAEVAGRDPSYRAEFDSVVSRSFGPPAVVAECAAPLLRVGGSLVVSEPPGSVGARWDTAGLALVGMELGPTVADGTATLQVIHQVERCPDRFPRRTGAPAKRPIF